MDSMKCMNNIFGRPCGYCMACRINRQRDKKVRLCHESESWKDKVFITLTYDDEHVPTGRTLVKRDLQLFMKRFRKAVEPTRIKFFACGEYGDDTQRPHYHIIIFGVGMKDSVFSELKYIPGKDIWYCKCSAWDKGFVSLNPVTPARCSYVAKYCLKKVGGPMEKEHYGERAREFCLTSKGIGLEWAQNHSTMLKNNLTYIQQGRQKLAIPRYYIDKIFDYEDKSRRATKINRELKKANENVWKDFSENCSRAREVGAYQQWVKDKHEARYGRFYKRLQMKGKTNNV